MFYKTQGPSAVPPNELWQEMLAWHKQKFLMAASVPETAGVDLEKTMGLVEGHGNKETIIFHHFSPHTFFPAYGILNVKESAHVKGLRLVQIRNPWGDSTEWKGDYSDNSPLWTEELKQEFGYVKADDGTFWMKFSDFDKYFNDLVAVFYKDGWVQSFSRLQLPRQPKTFVRLHIYEKTTLRLSFNQVRNSSSVIHLRFTVSDHTNAEVGTSGKALSSAEVISSNEMTLHPAVYVITAIIYSKDVDKLPLDLTLTAYADRLVHFDTKL